MASDGNMSSFLGCSSEYFALFGAATASYLALKLALSLWSGFKAYFLSKSLGISQKLRSNGAWAVVTGATDGIGKAYAQELAALGMKVVLVSRTMEKLTDIANEIKSKYGVETKVIAADFTGGPEIYEKIKRELGDLEVGVLVNNVGMGYHYPEYFLNIPEDKTIYDLMNVNIYSLTMMTRIVMPGMVARKKGAVINLSSASAIYPSPFLTVYSAAKAYVDFFSQALQLEYLNKGITVQSVKPFFVATKMSRIRKHTFFTPGPTSYVRSALGTVGIQGVTFGCVSHAIQGWAIALLGETLYTKISTAQLLATRKKALAKQKNK